MKEFRRLVGKIIDDDTQHDHMPDYAFSIDGDNVVVRPKKKSLQTALPLPVASLLISGATIEEARLTWRRDGICEIWKMNGGPG